MTEDEIKRLAMELSELEETLHYMGMRNIHGRTGVELAEMRAETELQHAKVMRARRDLNMAQSAYAERRKG
jgi:hypothetical protein